MKLPELKGIDYTNIDYHKIFTARVNRLNYLRKNPHLIPAFKKYYSENPADFINSWLVTYDPRKDLKTIPFILYPRQQEYIQWLNDRYREKEDGILEKSRDMGITYCSGAWAITKWLFEPNFKAGIGSRKESLVDRLSDPDSIFEKLRMMIKLIPDIFLPTGFNFDKHMPFLKILNPENGSAIVGEAGDQIGRGGRSSMYLLDEFAFVERAHRADAALSQNSDCKIYFSTPNGTNNKFYEKRFSGNFPVFTFHWKDDPRKGQDWYDEQKRKLDPLILAQEVDLDYEVDSELLIIPKKMVMAAVDLNIKRIDEGLRMGGFDVADEGADKNAYTDGKGNKIIKVTVWDDDDPNRAAREAHGMAKERKTDTVRFDSVGVGAGAKGEFRTLLGTDKNAKIKFIAVNTGSGVNKQKAYQVIEGIKNEDMFLNLRAESWWRVRRKFEKTFDYVVNKNKNIDVNDLVSIPNDPELINELSSVRYKRKENGKIAIEKKEDMRKRGIKSPNKADSVVLYFTATPEKKPLYNM